MRNNPKTHFLTVESSKFKSINHQHLLEQTFALHYIR